VITLFTLSYAGEKQLFHIRFSSRFGSPIVVVEGKGSILSEITLFSGVLMNTNSPGLL
jgi:hypothetical protein